MATPEQQVNDTRQAFEELAGQGKIWVELEEVALRSMAKHRAAKRSRRSRLANSIADMFALRSGSPRKPSFRFRHQTQLAASHLEAEGQIEHRFTDSSGRLIKKPAGRADYRDRRYRLVPEVTEGPEALPEDRFKSVAKRIAALPEAKLTKDPDGHPYFSGAQVALGVGKNSQAPVWAHLGVTYRRSDAVTDGEPEPRGLSVRLDYEKGQTNGDASASTDTYFYVAADHLGGNALQRHHVSNALTLLEDTVRAAELSRVIEGSETELNSIYSRSFATLAPVELPSEPRRFPGTYAM